MSSDQAHRQWLLQQLPQLESAGVLDAAAAARLRAHFALAAGPARQSWTLIIFGALGAILIGLGIVLLFAHNWESWSRATRTAVSLLPLLVSQALCAYALLRRADSTAWCEATAALNALALAAAIALIGQTYHIQGDLGAFLLTCALLALPLVYLLDSTLVALWFVLSVTLWTEHAGAWAPAYVPFMAVLAPYVMRHLRADRRARRPVVVLWALALSAPLVLFHLAPGVPDGAWPVAYAALFALFYLADARWLPHDTGHGRRPLRLVGQLGLAVLAVMLCIDPVIEELAYWEMLRDTSWREDWIVWVLPLAALALWLWSALRQPQAEWLLFGGVPLAMLLLELLGDGAGSLLLAHVYALAMAAAIGRRGIREGRLTALNLGLAMLASIILIRFVDSDLPYTVRAIGFIALGAGFLAANLFLIRRRTA